MQICIDQVYCEFTIDLYLYTQLVDTRRFPFFDISEISYYFFI